MDPHVPPSPTYNQGLVLFRFDAIYAPQHPSFFPNFLSSVPRDHCAPVVGLVGGIGSGKSALAEWVSQHAPVVVLDGDHFGHQALQEDEARQQILNRFPECNPGNQQVDRRILATLVFGDTPAARAARAELESIIHPRIHRSLQTKIQEHRTRADCDAILVDAAVLFEAGWDTLCDHVVYVEVPESQRLARVTSTRDWDRTDYLARQASQWPLDRKQAAADTSLDNSGPLAAAGARLLTLLQSLHGTPPTPPH
ncbi:MAG: dephospho-CoA kinase [Planctomycetaceae bacterium]|nr:dephospho-CoA kinase [Planctomycetaceae bacterium]